MITLQSMELTDDQSLDTVMPIPMADKPRYPFGLCLCLTNDELEKLGIDPKEAEVGGMFMMHAMVKVTSVSCNETEGGEQYRVEGQIEQMAVDGDDITEEAQAPARKSIYKTMSA